MTKASTASKRKYNEKAYDRIALTVKKGKADELKTHAQQHGESLNGFINRAISETVERDNAGSSGGSAALDITDKS